MYFKKQQHNKKAILNSNVTVMLMYLVPAQFTSYRNNNYNKMTMAKKLITLFALFSASTLTSAERITKICELASKEECEVLCAKLGG